MVLFVSKWISFSHFDKLFSLINGSISKKSFLLLFSYYFAQSAKAVFLAAIAGYNNDNFFEI